jgi:hypothetical protein
MKLWESIVMSLTVGFFIIGIHQLFLYGLMGSYWLFMLCAIGLMVLNLGKKPTLPSSQNTENSQIKKNQKEKVPQSKTKTSKK